MAARLLAPRRIPARSNALLTMHCLEAYAPDNVPAARSGSRHLPGPAFVSLQLSPAAVRG